MDGRRQTMNREEYTRPNAAELRSQYHLTEIPVFMQRWMLDTIQCVRRTIHAFPARRDEIEEDFINNRCMQWAEEWFGMRGDLTQGRGIDYVSSVGFEARVEGLIVTNNFKYHNKKLLEQYPTLASAIQREVEEHYTPEPEDGVEGPPAVPQQQRRVQPPPSRGQGLLNSGGYRSGYGSFGADPYGRHFLSETA